MSYLIYCGSNLNELLLFMANILGQFFGTDFYSLATDASYRFYKTIERPIS